jgi:hypothetical protein
MISTYPRIQNFRFHRLTQENVRMHFLLCFFLFLFQCLFLCPQVFANASVCSSLYSINQSQTTDTRSISQNIYNHLTPVEQVHIKKWSVFEKYHEFPLYGFNDILFLSDGHQAEKNLITDREHQFIISSDFNNYPGVHVMADNNKLPFADNSFDFILMNRGLCICHGGTSCGGIQTQKEHMLNFIEQIVRIINKKRSSLGIFTGYSYKNQFAHLSPKLWQQAISEAKLKYPNLQFAILNSHLSTQVDSEFMGFAISTNQWEKVSTQIKRIHPEL